MYWVWAATEPAKTACPELRWVSLFHRLPAKINNKDPWSDGWQDKVKIRRYEVWAPPDVIPQCISSGLEQEESALVFITPWFQHSPV